MADRTYPVTINVHPATEQRNRLTTAFRIFLGIPHILLVGGPAVAGAWFGWQSDQGLGWSTGGGVLGAVACVVTLIVWFTIVFAGSHPDGLRKLSVFYLRWRVRAIAYLMLLRDEYPPFGDGEYAAEVELPEAPLPRNRLSVFFRVLLALPHIFLLAILSIAWAFTTAVAWLMILIGGRYPETLYGFSLGMLAWGTRVDAYLLLLRDEYPPFTLRV